MKQFRRDEKAEAGTGTIGLVVGIVLTFGVLLSITGDIVSTQTTLQNDTLNFTASRHSAATAMTWGDFIALANTSTNLTPNSQYLLDPANHTVTLKAEATNLSGCGVFPHTQNCNYFATYYVGSSTLRTIAPILILLVVVAALLAVVAYLRREG